MISSMRRVDRCPLAFQQYPKSIHNTIRNQHLSAFPGGRGFHFMGLTHDSTLLRAKGTDEVQEVDDIDLLETVVLRQVYPAMMKHIEEYGNPNIPLGTTDGKRCKTIRRLAFEQKLTNVEMEWLESINFRFNSFEEVYEEADFNDCLRRLIEYEEANKTNYQIPKKYNLDPELGAWVTMIRRLGRDGIEAERRQLLDDINFAWVSTRKCGSSFMKNYRAIKERLDECVSDGKIINEEAYKMIIQDHEVSRWIRAQKQAFEKGNLSETRCEYMDDIGLKWREF